MISGTAECPTGTPEWCAWAIARIEAQESALKEADGVADHLAAARRPWGYVISMTATLDGILEGYLKYRAKAASL